MAQSGQRMCLCCGEFFDLDHRNRERQSGPDIRALTEYQSFWETHSQVDPKEDSDGNVYH